MAVFGRDAGGVGIELDGQGMVQRRVETAVDRQLRLAHGDRPVRRDRLGERDRLGHGLASLRHARDQTPALGGVRVDAPPAEDQLLGPRRPDQSWQELRPAAPRHDAAHDLRLGERRAPPGDDEVAVERQLQAAGQRVAVDRRDDRLAALHDCPERRLEDAVLGVPLRVRHALALLEVGARAERPLTGPAQHDRPHLAVVGERVDQLRDLPAHPRVDRVQHVRTVERHDDDVRCRPLDQQVRVFLVGHAASLSGRSFAVRRTSSM